MHKKSLVGKKWCTRIFVVNTHLLHDGEGEIEEVKLLEKLSKQVIVYVGWI
jgi:hypothetical protein